MFFTVGTEEGHGIYVGSLDDDSSKRLFDADSGASFAAPDQIFFVRQGTLFAPRVHLRMQEMIGNPILVASAIPLDLGFNGAPAFSVSLTGAVIYRSGKREREFVWLDRFGRQIGTLGRPDDSQPGNMRVSPDGQTVAVDRAVIGNTDIWLMDVSRGGLRKLTSDPAPDYEPIWSPDSRQITYSSRKNKGNLNIYHLPANGSANEETLVESSENAVPVDWSFDGRYLLYSRSNRTSGEDLWIFDSREKKSFAVAATGGDQDDGRFSPDGHWIALESSETGRYEIYLQSFPGQSVKFPVSTNGGRFPQWRGDGKEIFYFGLDNRLMAIPITLTSNGTPKVGTPVALFSTRAGTEYSASRDGQKFLINTLTEDAATIPITILMNWRPPQ